MKNQPSILEIQYAQQKNARNELRVWMEKHQVPGWSNESDDLNVEVWTQYWSKLGPFSKSTKHWDDQWNSFLDLRNVSRLKSIRKWFENELQHGNLFISTRMAMLKAQQWWGTDWITQHALKSKVPHIFNNLELALKNRTSIVDEFWINAYSGLELGQKCVEYAHSIKTKKHGKEIADNLDYAIKDFHTKLSPLQYQQLMDVICNDMLNTPEHWKKLWAHMLYTTDNYMVYSTVIPLPPLNDEQKKVWLNILQDISLDDVEDRIQGCRKHWTVKEQSIYMEDSYALAAYKKYGVDGPQRLVAVLREYNSQWIDENLAYIENKYTSYSTWWGWLYPQRHNIHRWSPEQRQRAANISNRIPLPQSINVDIEPALINDASPGFIDFIQTIMPIEKCIDIWKSPFNAATPWHKCLAFMYKKELCGITWDSNVRNDLLLKTMDPQKIWTVQEKEMIDGICSITDNNFVIMALVQSLISEIEQPSCPPIELP